MQSELGKFEVFMPYTARACHMYICLMSYCQCEFTRNPRAEPRQRRVDRRRGGRGRKSGPGSAGRSDDQWKHSVKSENHTPSSAKRRSSKRPPNLTNLRRASDETVVLHMAKYGSRTLRVTANRLSNGQGAGSAHDVFGRSARTNVSSGSSVPLKLRQTPRRAPKTPKQNQTR